MPASPDDLYTALGVNRGAPPEVIHRAYRQAAKAAHPDRGGSPERWALIALARDTLADATRRKLYDETGDTDVIDAAVKQTVYDAIAQIVSQADRMGDLTTFDIVKDAIQMLRDNLRNIEAMRGNLRTGARSVHKVIDRFKSLDGAPNLLHEILAEQFAGAIRGEQALETQKQITERAIAILKDHRFEYTDRGGMW